VVEGDDRQVLMPGDRYAQMRNVYFIPSVGALISWLEKCGFEQIRLVDKTTTSTDEQRRTSWMTSDSLANFLHPDDPGRTVEGYPAPLRATLLARKP